MKGSQIYQAEDFQQKIFRFLGKAKIRIMLVFFAKIC